MPPEAHEYESRGHYGEATDSHDGGKVGSGLSSIWSAIWDTILLLHCIAHQQRRCSAEAFYKLPAIEDPDAET